MPGTSILRIKIPGGGRGFFGVLPRRGQRLGNLVSYPAVGAEAEGGEGGVAGGAGGGGGRGTEDGGRGEKGQGVGGEGAEVLDVRVGGEGGDEAGGFFVELLGGFHGVIPLVVAVHGFLTVATHEAGAGFGPSVLLAGATGKFYFALGAFVFDAADGVPVEEGLICEEFTARQVKRSTFDDVMCHLLAGLFSARLPGVGGHEADVLHFLPPLAIMVAIAGGLAKIELPEVGHFMDKGREDVPICAGFEGLQVEGDFIQFCLRSATFKGLVHVVSHLGLLAAVKNDQGVGQFSRKEGLIKIRIGII